MRVAFALMAVALASAATPALAQTYASVSAGTDYVSRGTTQTFGDPAVMVYVEHAFDEGPYVAAFVANIDFDNAEGERLFGDDGAFLETDLFVGYRGTAGTVAYDAGLAIIAYQGTKPTPAINPGGNWDMVEAYVKLSRPVGPVTLGTMLAVTPDYFNNFGPSIWAEASASTNIAKNLSASAAFGRQEFFEDSSTGFPADFSDYNTWNLGVTYAITDTLSANVRYHDNDTNVDLGPIYEPRAVVTLTKSF